MSEIVENEPSPSSSDIAVASELKEESEPEPKRRKISEKEATEKLEHRLGGILCCAVCLDLPRAAVYQCSNGHLMCAACFTHLLADARLRDESATCPNCRVEISKSSASRNLAVEKAVSELPSECKYCAQIIPRHSIEHHEEKRCEDRKYKFSQVVVNTPVKQSISPLWGLVRIVSGLCKLLMFALRRTYIVREIKQKRRKYYRLSGCRFACIGCPWRGPHHELAAHEAACAHPRKSGAEVVEVLAAKEKEHQDLQAVYNHVLELLSYEKITFNDVQLKPYRTDEFVNKLYYETSRFSAFNHQWVVKAYVNNHQRDPTQSYQRDITYQLILKTKSACPLSVQYVALRGPYGEAEVAPRVHTYTFGADDATDAPEVPLPLADPFEANRLLSNKAIHFRLIMFLASK